MILYGIEEHVFTMEWKNQGHFINAPVWKSEQKPLNLGVMLVLPFHRKKVVNPFHKPVFSLELLGTKAPDPFHKCYAWKGSINKHLNLMKIDVSKK